jgi:hypothetical protein
MRIRTCLLGILVSASVWSAPRNHSVTTTELTQTQGRTISDLNGDGIFDGQGGLDVSGYVISCSDDDTGTRRVWRTVLEFDLNAFLPQKGYKKIRSATLVFETDSSRNLRVQNPGGSFAPAPWIVNGYAGDGLAQLADAYQTTPIVPELQVPAYSFVEIDVTDFVKSLLAAGSGFAGFMMQIPGDYLPGTFQDSWVIARDEPRYSVVGPRLVIVQAGGKR